MLKGMVDTAEQKSRAEQIARGTQGVVGVQNNLTLKGQPTP
jgi:osmotically-inducible protein OsmY